MRLPSIQDSYARYKAPPGASDRERLVLDHLRLVLAMAFRAAKRAGCRRFVPSREDFTQEGMLGLLRAADWAGDSPTKFDPEKGCFANYATQWIQARIWESIRRGGKASDLLIQSEEITDRAREEEDDDVAEAIERLSRAIDKLDPFDADVLSRRFGLGGNEEQTLEEIGRSYGLSESRIRQVESRAMARLPALMAVEK